MPTLESTTESASAPRPLPAWPLQLLASAVIGAVLWLVYGGGYVSLDAMWSLVWGRDLAAGSGLAESGTTTPHVLSNLIGLALSPLGPDADRGLVAVEFLAAGTLVWVTACLAREIAGTAAGVVAGVLMALREQLLYATTSTFLDVIVATFVVWAALLVIRGVRVAAAERVAATDGAAEDRGGAGARARLGWPAPASPWAPQVLLLLAGLLRPEAWVLAGALWLWGVRSRGGLGLGEALLVVSAPLAWIVADAALAGDALFSVHETTRVNAVVRAGRDIPDTFVEHLVSLPRTIVRVIGPEAFLMALLVSVAALRPSFARSRPLSLVAVGAEQALLVRVLLAGAALYAGVLTAEALSGSLLFSRFSIALAGVAVAITAVGIVAVARALAPADARRGIRIVAGLALAFALVQVPLLAKARSTTGAEHDRYDAARAAVVPGVPCTPVAVPNTNIRAYVAVWAGVRGDEVVDASRGPIPTRATYVTATGEAEKLLRDPSFRQLEAFPDAPALRTVGDWQLTTTCEAGLR